jgi:hypothetical protein
VALPKDEVFRHPLGGGVPQEVQVIVVVQQLVAVPQLELVFQCI